MDETGAERYPRVLKSVTWSLERFSKLKYTDLETFYKTLSRVR
jgi:hypothetical protein